MEGFAALVGQHILTARVTVPQTRKKPATRGRGPATNPAEKGEVETLLAVHRPVVPVLIARALDVLPRCKAALELARRDPREAQDPLRESRLGIDGLSRYFHISVHNSDSIDIVVNRYRTLLGKVLRLPLDQAATDYPTFKREARKLAFNADGTPAKVPAFSDPARFKMFFNPIYRPFDATMKEPFTGFAPIALQGLQIREMCHFYLNMVDGSPALSTAVQCLNLAQSFERFAMHLAQGVRFRAADEEAGPLSSPHVR